MPGLESLINQQIRPIRILTTLLQNGTLPQALLFTGAAGVGKQAAAIALAMACNCQAETSGLKAENRSGRGPVRGSAETRSLTMDFCGVCKSCNKIEAGNHPDVIQLQAEGASIQISQIRDLVDRLTKKPYEAKTRVVILSEAPYMTAASSNALLKSLEEPPENTVLVLIATHKSDLLPTIVSRCQLIGFGPIPEKKLASWINEKHEIAPETAGILAAMAKGNLSRAQQMIEGNWLKNRAWVLDEIESLSLQPIARLLALAEKISKDRKAVVDTLEIIKSWFRDLIIYRYAPGKIINQDVTHKIEIASRQKDIHMLLSKIDAVQKAQNRLAANTNLRLFMENLLIGLV